MRRGRRVGVLVLTGVLVGLFALPAYACSVRGSVPLSTVLSNPRFDLPAGVYEQKTLAAAPSMLIRERATASVVTRVWGEAPANTGVQYEGGEWFWFARNNGDSCKGIDDSEGNIIFSDGPVGTVGYGYAPFPENTEGPLSPEEAAAQGTVPWHRSAPSLITEGGAVTASLSESELEMLEAVYGPPVEVVQSSTAGLQSTVGVWWPSVLSAAAVASLLLLIRQRRRPAATTDASVDSAIGLEA